MRERERATEIKRVWERVRETERGRAWHDGGGQTQQSNLRDYMYRTLLIDSLVLYVINDIYL